MTSIDSLTTAAPMAAESTLPEEDSTTTVSATTAPNQTATTNAPDLSSLQGMVSDVQSQLATDPAGESTMGKIVGILAGVVSALVSLVSNIWGKQSGTATPPTAKAEGTSDAVAKSSATSAPASGTSSGSSTAKSSATQSPTPASTPTSSGVRQSNFDVTQNDKGAITVRTLDGYLVRAEGKDHAWSITGPDGMTTRIWGDPHVSESDGDAWDFKNRGTFFFGKNKVTVEVVPYGNGQTISSAINLYSGDERVTIKGIDTNKPIITAVSHDGHQHDDSLADGDVYSRAVNKTGEAWRTKSGTKTVTMGAK